MTVVSISSEIDINAMLENGMEGFVLVYFSEHSTGLGLGGGEGEWKDAASS